MKALSDHIKIKAPAQRIFATLKAIFSSNENYRKWHEDHVSCHWEGGRPFTKGGNLVVNEYLHGHLHQLRFIVKEIVNGKKLEFRLGFPQSLFCPKGSFQILEEGDYSIFVATLYFRYASFFRICGSRYIDLIQVHMQEEGQNLKTIVEERLLEPAEENI